MKCEERICPLPDPTLVVSYSPSGSPSQPSFCCQAVILGKRVEAINPADVVPKQSCLAQIAAGICIRNIGQIEFRLL